RARERRRRPAGWDAERKARVAAGTEQLEPQAAVDHEPFALVAILQVGPAAGRDGVERAHGVDEHARWQRAVQFEVVDVVPEHAGAESPAALRRLDVRAGERRLHT